MSLFELRDVVKRYGRVTALREMTLVAPKGAIGLLGPNGAGKTTMIRTLLGLIRIDAGGGEVLGRNIVSERLRIRELVGLVPEDECLFPGVTGIEFVAYAGELCGMPRGDALRRAHEMLDYAGLGEARYRSAEGYSTGMKQRLKIAAAIVHDPELLIMDEPTNGLDPAGREEILALARDLTRNKGMNLIFASHLLPDVESVCDHIVVIGGGRPLTSGSLAELKRRDNRLFLVRVRDDAAPFAARLRELGCEVRRETEDLGVRLPEGADEALVWRAAAESGAQVRSLRPRQTSLEEVFLKALAESS